MNWEMIGALGEVAGAVAVVVSLLYLARQVAMSNRLAQAEASRAPTSDLNSMNAAFVMEPLFRQGFEKVLQGAVPSDFDVDQAMVLEFYLISAANISAQLFKEVRQGIVDEGALREFADPVFTLPWWHANWARSRLGLAPSFVEYLEATYGLEPPSDDDSVSATIDPQAHTKWPTLSSYINPESRIPDHTDTSTRRQSGDPEPKGL